MKHSQKYFRGQQTYLGNVNGQVEEIYGGHNIIKAFNKEEDVIEVSMRQMISCMIPHGNPSSSPV